MLRRQIRLFALVAILVSGIIMTADAGGKRRRQSPVVCTPKAVASICPLYKWMDNGSYCSWYAVQCDENNNQISPPVSYDAACDAGPQYPCQGCVPVMLDKRAYDTGLKTGYPGPLLNYKPIDPQFRERMRDKKNDPGHLENIRIQNVSFVDKVADVDVGGGRTIRVQLKGLVTVVHDDDRPKLEYGNKMEHHVIHAGTQIDPRSHQPNVAGPLPSRPHENPAYTGVRIVTYLNQEYVVLLKDPNQN